jgi:hypothetical protein
VLARQGDRIIKAARSKLEILKRQVFEAEARASTGVVPGRNFEEAGSMATISSRFAHENQA